MKKYLLDCDSFRFRKTKEVTEGGMSRNLAIRKYLVEKMNYKPVEISGNSTLSALQVILFFISHRNSQIFIMYPTRFFLMGGNNKANRKLGDIAVKSFCRASMKNTIILDVSDIKYEQFIDLEIPCPDLKLIEDRERAVFGASASFVFASSSMKEFAILKYKIKEDCCDICINGGMIFDKELHSDVLSFKDEISDKFINCVYAGTLNKGRMIDKMLDCFSNLSSARLYLMGPMGEWIEEYLTSNHIHNVFYLGAKDEKIAHQIVSCCDLGLIPYDESRLYYNIAYPTKLSFYITAGIPYLATPVKEVKMIDEKGMGFVGTITEWDSIIMNLCRDDIISVKANVERNCNEFTWDYNLHNSILMNL